jgi:hypothetical protein
MAGWIKLHRSILEKGWIKKPEYVQLWVVLLLMASHDNREYFWNGKTVKLKSGQLITGRKALSEKTGISQTTIERILKCFESEHQIGQQKTSTSRLISILNWSKHQQVGQQNGQRMDNGWTADGQRTDTNKELKNGNNDNNEKKNMGEPKKFTPPELFDVIDYFKEKGFPIELAKRAFEFYDTANWIDSKGNKVKNWKQKMLSVWLKPENKTQQNGQSKPSRQSATIDVYKEKYAGQSWINDEPNN